MSMLVEREGKACAEPLRDGHGDVGCESAPATSPRLRGRSPLERIEALSVPEPNSGCWLWLGSLDGNDRPKVSVGGRSCIAYRVALEIRLGRKLRRNILACHKCDVPLCVNPEHVFPGTHVTNMRDMVRKGRRADVRNRRKLTFDDAREMRCLNAQGVSPRELALRYQVSEKHVQKILNGSRWSEPLLQAAE